MLRHLLLVLAALGLAAEALAGQAGAKPAPPSDAQRQQAFSAIMQVQEPGAQMRQLENFARKNPTAPELTDVYNAIIQDAVALSDDHTVLLYNEKLEAAEPNDLSQRIKVLNLLLLETDPTDRRRAQQESALFAQMVEAKAGETPPKEMGPVEWRLNLARLRSIAALFQGAAAQNDGQYTAAEPFFIKSLQQSQSEEAAEHLGQVEVALGKIPQAVNDFALALALPGQTIAGRDKLRRQAGKLYASLHGGSEHGFGDLILQRFDDAASRDAAEQASLAPSATKNAGAASAAAIVLSSLDGKRSFSLAQEKGKVVVVDFWATWCGPCLVQHPIIEKLRREFSTNHNVIFVAVNEDEDPSKVAPFLTEHGWGADTWLDAGLGPYLGVDSLPTTMIFSPKGAVVYRAEGFVPSTFEAELRGAITGELDRAHLAAAAGAHPGP
ncbi:MAG: redoxin family protein [Terriglobales bacterium]